MMLLPTTSVEPTLHVGNLSVTYRRGGSAPAVKDVNLHLAPGEILGIVGESGSGKSTLCMALACLLDKTQCTITGDLTIGGNSVTISDPEDQTWFDVRGSKIGYIFQDAHAALNPLLTVQQLLVQPQTCRGISEDEAKERARQVLHSVEIPDVPQRLRQYPHELSGGMKQRVVIAAALVSRPEVLIADEPTTALDVTLQSQIIQLLQRIQLETELSIIFISHNIDLVADLSQRILVMQSGQIIEEGPTDRVLTSPEADYTKYLLEFVPRIETIDFYRGVEHWRNHE